MCNLAGKVQCAVRLICEQGDQEMRSAIRKVVLLLIVVVVIAGILYFFFIPSRTGTTPPKTWFLSRTVPISKILQDPREYEGKVVIVAGDVTKSLSIVGWGVYRVADTTGEIPVLTKAGCPARGAHVKVRGHIRSAFTVGDYSGAVIIEEPSHKH